jgi:anti-sigma factor RsiW
MTMMNDLLLNLDLELLVAYVDKELPPAQMAAVEAALMHNGGARETVRQLRLSAAAAAHAYDAALNELPDRLLLATGAGAPPPVPQMKPRRQIEPRPPGMRLRRLLPLAATFAALAIGLAGGYELRALGVGVAGPERAEGYAPAAAPPADLLAAAL